MVGKDTSADDAHLHPLTNVPTKLCQPSTPHRIQELGQDFKTHCHYNKITP